MRRFIALGLLALFAIAGAVLSQMTTESTSDNDLEESALTVPQTLGLAYARYTEMVPYHLYRRANPKAREGLYKILADEGQKSYHENVWRILGYIGVPADVDRIEARFQQFSGPLGEAELDTVFGMFDCLGLMCSRNVDGAAGLLDRMQKPDYWRNAKFSLYAVQTPDRPGVEYQVVVRVMYGYALSRKSDLKERVDRILAGIQDPVLRESMKQQLDLGSLRSSAAFQLNRENDPASPDELDALTSILFNGDTEAPGPGAVLLSDEEESRRFREQVRGRQEAAKAAITDPRARRLLDLAKDVMFAWDDNTMELTGEVHLILDGPKITDDVLALVDALPGITQLQIENAAVTDQGLRHLAALGKLESLLISSNQAVTGEGLERLETIASLKRIRLSRVPGVGNEGLEHVGAMTNLEDVKLEELAITFAGLKRLADLKRLRGLYVTFAPATATQPPAEQASPQPAAAPPAIGPSPPTISARARQLVDLAQNVSLGAQGEVTYLSLSGEKITDETLAMLDAVPDLTHLSLSLTAVTDDGLKHLAKLKRLKDLSISRTPSVTDNGLTHLESLTTLTTIHLLYLPKVTDQGLTHLKALDKLEGVNLTSLAITFAGLDNLADLKNLRRLEVHFPPPERTPPR